MSYNLTDDQQAAYSDVVELLTTKLDKLIIEGGAGTGKTTLVKTILEEWPQFVSLSNGAFKNYETYLTATTNKAADALAMSTNQETCTIHSLLGLRVVSEGYRKTVLKDNGKAPPDGALIIIDEASFIDEELLRHINRKTKGCKVIFLGDPNQLKPVGSDNTPVFDAGYRTASLKQIVRQSDDSPIQTLSRALRGHVSGDPMPKAGVDGINIFHMPKEEFEHSLIQDCKTGLGNTVRALTWTNAKAIYYNELVSQSLSGSSEIKVGDTVVVNKQVQLRGNYRLPTDSTVLIMGLSAWETDEYGITSRTVETSMGHKLRQAKDHADTVPLIKAAYSSDDVTKANYLENLYVDLRLMYASTINKSQGSTYDTVYIDLNDLSGCRDKDQVRRLLYVAVSRARTKVVFTGDL